MDFLSIWQHKSCCAIIIYSFKKEEAECKKNYFDADSKEIIFTSGGTESNNLAIFGIVNANQNRGRHLITSAVEHSSVNQVFKELEKCCRLFSTKKR
ncbi:MAG: aminotransferase class V-fold PLP-dependent enzyme, partial [Halanaerobiales bacterium]